VSAKIGSETSSSATTSMIRSREAGSVTAPTRVQISRKYHSPTGISPPASSAIDSRTITTAATRTSPAKINVNRSTTNEHSSPGPVPPSVDLSPAGTQNVDSVRAPPTAWATTNPRATRTPASVTIPSFAGVLRRAGRKTSSTSTSTASRARARGGAIAK